MKFDTVDATFATVEIFHMVHGEVDLDMEKEHLVGVRVELFGNAQDQHAVFFSGLEQERRYWFRVSVLGERAVPPWKRARRAKMRLDPKGRMAGMVALADGWLGLVLLPDGGLRRQAAGPRGEWAELHAPALAELLVQPVAAGGILLVGLDREGRPQLATLADPRADKPRWHSFGVTAAGTPVAAEGPDGIVHLLVTDPRGGLWHGRAGADAGELAQVAERVAARPPEVGVDGEGRLAVAFADVTGVLRVVTIARDRQIERGDGPGRDFRIPLAIVPDGDQLLLAALDAEDRVAVRLLRDAAVEWEVLGALDALLEGPIDPVPPDRHDRARH